MTHSASVVHSCVIKHYRYVYSSLQSYTGLRTLISFSKCCSLGVWSIEPKLPKNQKTVTVLNDVPYQLQAATVISPLTFEHPLTRGLLHELIALLLVQVLGIWNKNSIPCRAETSEGMQHTAAEPARW